VVYGVGGLAVAVGATALIGIWPTIALPFAIGGIDPTMLGVAFWTTVCLATSSLGLAEQGRAAIIFAIGPLIATAALGGPAAVAWVALLGTFEAREVRGGVPWYGVLANHGAGAIAWTACGLTILALRSLAGPGAGSFANFVVIMAGAAVGSLLSLVLTMAAVSARTGQRPATTLPIGMRELGLLLASEAALAWLVSWAYPVAWWSPFLFFVTDTAAAKSLTRHRAAWGLRHDPLTELSNGLGLDERIAEMRRVPLPGVCVLYLDLDGFKAINDHHDHNVGDDVLRVTGRRLAEACRNGDFLARLHGDEFVVLAHGIASEAEADALGRRLIAAVEPPIDHAAGELRVSATVGIRLVRDLAGIDEAIREADAAMSHAKDVKAAASGRTRDRR
jgi:diguanylate cyclase (GGDEF)-like protein